MSYLVVCPLDRIAETAVRHGAKSMISLMAREQAFHRPGVIAADRHLTLGINDIAFDSKTMVTPQDEHVAALISFAKDWDREAPLLIHCWMGISRSPATALIVALTLAPDQDDIALARRLRTAAPSATPNRRLIAIGDRLLGRDGRLVAAVEAIGRGAEASCGSPFVLALRKAPTVSAVERHG